MTWIDYGVIAVLVLHAGTDFIGTLERRFYDYDIPANAKRVVNASALRKGKAWTVVAMDVDQALGEEDAHQDGAVLLGPDADPPGPAGLDEGPAHEVIGQVGRGPGEDGIAQEVGDHPDQVGRVARAVCRQVAMPSRYKRMENRATRVRSANCSRRR